MKAGKVAIRHQTTIAWLGAGLALLGSVVLLVVVIGAILPIGPRVASWTFVGIFFALALTVARPDSHRTQVTVMTVMSVGCMAVVFATLVSLKVDEADTPGVHRTLIYVSAAIMVLGCAAMATRRYDGADIIRIVVKVGLAVMGVALGAHFMNVGGNATVRPAAPSDRDVDADVDVFVPSVSDRIDVIVHYSPVPLAGAADLRKVEYQLYAPEGQRDMEFVFVLHGRTATLSEGFQALGDIRLVDERRVRQGLSSVGGIGRDEPVQVFVGRFGGQRSARMSFNASSVRECSAAWGQSSVLSSEGAGTPFVSLTGLTESAGVSVGQPYWLYGKNPSIGLPAGQVLSGLIDTSPESVRAYAAYVSPKGQNVCIDVSPPSGYTLIASDPPASGSKASPTETRVDDSKQYVSGVAPIARPTFYFRRSGWEQFSTQQSLIAGVFLGLAGSAGIALADSSLRKNRRNGKQRSRSAGIFGSDDPG